MARTVIVIGASALALAAAAVAVRAAALRMPARADGLPALAADAPDRILAAALTQFREQRGRIDPDLSRRAITAATVRPLDERPYVVAAVRALTTGREDDAIRLLERARALNPRQGVARLLLMDRYLQRGDVARATREIATNYRLVPNTASPLIAELARLLADPASRRATRAALAGNAELLNASLAALATSGMDAATLAGIAGPDAPSGRGPGGWRTVQIDALVAAGRIGAARAAWLDAYRVSPAEARQLPFDPGFTGKAAPPFGWALTTSEVGSAESSADGLAVEFFGRRSGVLASQLMMAPPGRYRLSYRIAGSDGGEGGSLAVTVECVAGARTVATLAAPKLSGGARRAAADLVIAADCPAQWLRIVGTAGEFASATSAAIDALTLSRTGA